MEDPGDQYEDQSEYCGPDTSINRQISISNKEKLKA
jgi:hypothetical protein